MNSKLQQHIYLASLELPVDQRGTQEVEDMAIKLAKAIYNDCFLIASAALSQEDADILLQDLNDNFGF